MADEALRLPASELVHPSSQRLSPAVRCRLSGEAGSSSTASPSAPLIVRDVLRDSGQPLDPPSRAFFEAPYGHDFGAVRVHADALASDSARALDAEAYTVGDHIAFGSGRYRPGTPGGRRLIAHELAHVVQQASAAAACVQRQTTYWSLPADAGTYGQGRGTRSHDHAQMRLRQAHPANLYTEVPVPGATAAGLDPERTGYADLFAAPGLVGVEFDDPAHPVFPDTSDATYFGNRPVARGDHTRLARPAANRGSSACGRLFRRGAYGICRMDSSDEIRLGELKPMNSEEEVLGTPQVTAYRDAFLILQTEINTFAQVYPAEVRPVGATWNAQIELLQDRAFVPADLRNPTSGSPYVAMIAEYTATGARTSAMEELGTMQVRLRGDGILGYR